MEDLVRRRGESVISAVIDATDDILDELGEVPNRRLGEWRYRGAWMPDSLIEQRFSTIGELIESLRTVGPRWWLDAFTTAEDLASQLDEELRSR